jgi:hypothetical protein
MLTAFTFFFLINVWVGQDALQNEAAAFQVSRLEAGLSVQSISANSADCASFLGPYGAEVANTGNSPVADFSKMDVLIDYRDAGNAPVVQRLTYDVDWSVAGISPDNVDPNSWNPGETASVNFSASPALDLQTRGRLVLMTPQGVSDSAYFTCVPTEYYLNNNPSPPTGDTNSQTILSMNPGVPTQTTLFNYDQDRDSLAGLLVLSGGSGAGEGDAAEHQVWRSGALLEDLHLGTVAISFWSAVPAFTLGTTGSATFYLRDFDGFSHTEIGDDVVFDGDWQGGSGTFVQRAASVGPLDYTIPEGNELEVKLMVDSSAVNNMWFAYDTSTHPALVQITP